VGQKILYSAAKYVVDLFSCIILTFYKKVHNYLPENKSPSHLVILLC
jgi:hypothetical protein